MDLNYFNIKYLVRLENLNVYIIFLGFIERCLLF